MVWIVYILRIVNVPLIFSETAREAALAHVAELSRRWEALGGTSVDS